MAFDDVFLSLYLQQNNYMWMSNHLVNSRFSLQVLQHIRILTSFLLVDDFNGHLNTQKHFHFIFTKTRIRPMCIKVNRAGKIHIFANYPERNPKCGEEKTLLKRLFTLYSIRPAYHFRATQTMYLNICRLHFNKSAHVERTKGA